MEVTRIIRNNKLHFKPFYMRVFHFVVKKKEKGPETGFLFFSMIPTFFKYLNSNHNTLSYLLFSKCLSWFLYLVVHRGTGVFSCFFCFVLFCTPLLERDSHFAVALHLPLCDRKTLKHCLFCRSRPPQLN